MTLTGEEVTHFLFVRRALTRHCRWIKYNQSLSPYIHEMIDYINNSNMFLYYRFSVWMCKWGIISLNMHSFAYIYSWKNLNIGLGLKFLLGFYKGGRFSLFMYEHIVCKNHDYIDINKMVNCMLVMLNCRFWQNCL